MTPTHTKKPVNVRAFVFNGHIDCLDQDHVNAKLIKCDNTFDDCIHCEHPIESHAYIKTLSGEAVTCPGDYVINNPQFPDDFYPCKPNIFNETYDALCEKSTTVNLLGANCCSSNYTLENDMYYRRQHREQLKLDAAKHLLQHGGSTVAQEYLEKCILEPANDGMSFGEVMALINKNSEILVSRKAYDIDYIYFNSETDQFESYTNGVKTLHSFNTKDYTANDWYVVN